MGQKTSKEKFTLFEEEYMKLTYSDYSSASLRKIRQSHNLIGYDPNGTASIICLIPGILRLLFLLLSPYSLIIFSTFLTSYIMFYIQGDTIQILLSPLALFSMFSILVSGIILLRYFYFPKKSPILIKKYGENPFGAVNRKGLYFCERNSCMMEILKKCPTLTSPEVQIGALPLYSHHTGKRTGILEPTPWMFTGDMRTIFPFLSFDPPRINYVRRYVRVPLNDGPLCDLKEEDDVSKYEGVALDWALPAGDIGDNYTASSSSSKHDNTEAPIAIVILAGLTGGSDEGYVRDFVSACRDIGWHSFVVIGRGLMSTPCESDAFFHGARTADLKSCVEIVHECLPSVCKIVVVGISMGGIIVANALARGELDGMVDGAICLAGTLDTNRNRRFLHSRDYWQPVLSQGLKEAFAAHPSRMRRMLARVGPEAQQRLDEVCNVADFDAKIIKPLVRYHDNEHYYRDMSPTKEMYKNVCVPFLIVHAQDDPILHVDSMPVEEYRSGKNTENICVLITSTGGHVGWPLGMNPWKHRWRFQNTIAIEFCRGIIQSDINVKDAKNLRFRGKK